MRRKRRRKRGIKKLRKGRRPGLRLKGYKAAGCHKKRNEDDLPDKSSAKRRSSKANKERETAVNKLGQRQYLWPGSTFFR